MSCGFLFSAIGHVCERASAKAALCQWCVAYLRSEDRRLQQAGESGVNELPRQADRTQIRQVRRTTYEYDAARRVVRRVRRTLDGRRLVREFAWNRALREGSRRVGRQWLGLLGDVEALCRRW